MKITKEKIEIILQDTCFTNFNETRIVKIHTGEKGGWDFSTAIEIAACEKDFDSLSKCYEKIKNDLYKFKVENRKLNNLWFVKIYKYFSTK